MSQVMPRFTISIHFLVKRNVAFVRDAYAEESWRWMWVILKPDAPSAVLATSDPAVLLQWSEHAGHAETKTACYEQAVKQL